MKRTVLFTQFPILFSSFFGVYAGGSFLWPIARGFVTGQNGSISQSDMGWVLLGALFISISLLNLIKFVDISGPGRETNLMFVNNKESRIMSNSYAIFFLFLAALSTYFFFLSLNSASPTVEAQQLALIILIIVNLVMAMLKLNEKRQRGRKRRFAINY